MIGRAAVTAIDETLAGLSSAAERMPDDDFLAEHAAAHDEPRSPAVDMVAATLEREWWRRWPDGRGEGEL